MSERPLLTAKELSVVVRISAWTLLKYKRDGRIRAEIDLPHKVLFDAAKVRKQLAAATAKRDRERFNGMIPTL